MPKERLLPATFRSKLQLGKPIDQDAEGDTGTSFTFVAFGLGMIGALCIGAGVSYTTLYLQGSYMALGFSTVGALCLLFVLAGIANPLLKWIKPTLGLQRGELLLIYIMMVVASPIPVVFTSKLLTQMIAPFYYATEANQWSSLIHPHIPHWMLPHLADAGKLFFEGTGHPHQVPWAAWLPALLFWQPFIWALFIVMIAAMVILRRQWVENERLVYPLAQVPLAMTQMGKEGECIPPFFKNRVMWAGFFIPALWSTLHGLYIYFPDSLGFARQVDIFHTQMPILRDSTSFIIALRFNILGFFYFIKTEVAFSLWVFNVLANLSRGIFGILGVSNSWENLGPGHGIHHSIQVYHSMGAMLVLFLGGLWAARRHLAVVWRKAVTGDPSIDDSQEILSYRAALIALMLGVTVIIAWLWIAGLPLWAAGAIVVLAAAMFIGFTRVVAEGGLSDGAPPVVPAGIIVSAVGSSALGSAGLVLLASTYLWTENVRSFVMASCANSLKLGTSLKGRRRPLFWAMLAALAIALVASTWMILELSYEHGNLNLKAWGSGKGSYDYVQKLLRYPTEPDIWGWLNISVGAVIMWGLTLARLWYAWWPLHPLGFPIGPTWIMDHLWFNMFLAWFIKVQVLKYGGAGLYNYTRPFFMGMILGQLIPGGVFLVIDHCTGTVGNVIFWG